MKKIDFIKDGNFSYTDCPFRCFYDGYSVLHDIPIKVGSMECQKCIHYHDMFGDQVNCNHPKTR